MSTKTNTTTKATATATAEPKKADKKEAVRVSVDSWLAEFTKAHENTVVKTWEKIPTCRSLKVSGVTYFEIYYSSRGVRLNAKSALIPEKIRPKDATIIKNGLDLCIPTFADNIPAQLSKYASACEKSLAAIAAAKAKAKAEPPKKAAEKPASK